MKLRSNLFTKSCAFFALLVMSLFVACPRDAQPTPGSASNTVTITFLSNGESTDDTATQVVVKGARTPLQKNTFTYNGSTEGDPGYKMFGGWSLEKIDATDVTENAKTPLYFDGDTAAFTEDTTLYARWGTPRTITFNSNGGKENHPNQVVVEEFEMPITKVSETFGDETNAPTGKEFAGWAEGGTKQIIVREIIVRDGKKLPAGTITTLDAIWMGFNTVAENTSFQMGGGRWGRENAGGGAKGSSFKVTFTKKFEMSDHEVTQKEWKDATGITQKQLVKNAGGYLYSDTEEYDYHPIAGVTWAQAIAYCNLLTIKADNGKTDNICYTSPSVKDWSKIDIMQLGAHSLLDVECDFTKAGYRLPTEAEWEYCARDCEPVGENYEAWSGTDDKSKLGEYAVYKYDDSLTYKHLKPVMSKKPNTKGYYDMSGNVWEWCWNIVEAYPSIDSTDYGETLSTGRNEENKYAARGGAWDSGTDSCRSTNRHNVGGVTGINSHSSNTIGFRVCRTVTP